MTETVIGLPEECPPGNAESPSGDYYRFVSGLLGMGDEPGENDWIHPYRKRGGQCAGRAEQCDCHAHSLFEDEEGAKAARDLIPGMRSKSIARVSLQEGMGVVLRAPTPHSDAHFEWWPSPAELIPDSVVVLPKP